MTTNTPSRILIIAGSQPRLIGEKTPLGQKQRALTVMHDRKNLIWRTDAIYANLQRAG
jgi:hypothetical protein